MRCLLVCSISVYMYLSLRYAKFHSPIPQSTLWMHNFTSKTPKAQLFLRNIQNPLLQFWGQKGPQWGCCATVLLIVFFFNMCKYVHVHHFCTCVATLITKYYVLSSRLFSENMLLAHVGGLCIMCLPPIRSPLTQSGLSPSLYRGSKNLRFRYYDPPLLPFLHFSRVVVNIYIYECCMRWSSLPNSPERKWWKEES